MTAKLRRGGSVTVYALEREIDPYETLFAESLAQHRFASIERSVTEQTSVGWVTPEDPTGETFSTVDMEAGNAIWLRIRRDVKALPAVLLEQRVAVRERALGRSLSKRELRELRDELVAEVMPRVLPSTTNTDVLIFQRERRILLFGTSPSARDAFGELWRATFPKIVIQPLGPEGLARDILPAELCKQLKDMAPVRWPIATTDECTAVTITGSDGSTATATLEAIEEAVEQMTFGFDSTFGFLGEEFLLWLWWSAETGMAEFDFPNGRTIGVSITDLLTFAPKHDQDTEQTLRRGSPTRTPEARTALRHGHRLGRARILIGSSDERAWELTLLGESLALASVKLPEDAPDTETQIDRNAERAGNWIDIATTVRELFARFLRVRTDAPAWSDVESRMRDWMAT